MKKNHLNKKAVAALMLALAAPMASEAVNEVNGTYLAAGCAGKDGGHGCAAGCAAKTNQPTQHSCAGGCGAKTEEAPPANSDAWKNNAMKRNNAAANGQHSSETTYDDAQSAKNAWNNTNGGAMRPASPAANNPNGGAMRPASAPANNPNNRAMRPADGSVPSQSQSETSWNQSTNGRSY